MSILVFGSTLYAVWSTWIVADKYHSDKIKDNPLLFFFSVCAYLIMLILLTTSPVAFLLLGVLNCMINIVFGLGLALLKPEVDLSKSSPISSLRNYWVYVLFDSLIIVISFLSIAMGG